jgi:hypothetical protein
VTEPRPARVVEGERTGWRALTLDNGDLRVTVLPDKGAEIVELIDARTGHAFLENYGGGWQELFPNAGDPCTYRGAAMPFHGEVATLPWDAEVQGGASVRLTVRCLRTPFVLERLMQLPDGRRELVIEETARNDSDAPADLVWGHHCVVGPPFLGPGCRLRAPAETLETIAEMWEATARLEPGQRSPWPHGRLRSGGTADLSEVPGLDAGSHDDVYLTGLSEGWVEVESPAAGLAFRLDFDAALFRWLVSWQPYGGAEAMPLAGSYALGIEPWITRLDLERAVESGEALELAPGDSLTTTLTAAVRDL